MTTIAKSRLLLAIYLMIALISIDRTDAQIPLQLLRRMHNVNASEFIDSMLQKNPDPQVEVQVIFNEQGSIDPEGKDAVVRMVADNAGCKPVVVSVNIPEDSNNPNVILFPPCIRIARCNGCCGKLLECVAVQAENVTYTVLKAVYNHPNSGKFDSMGPVSITVQRHIRCDCDCAERAEHCHRSLHSYDRDQCRCRCHNEFQATQCPMNKLWNHAQCACVCRENRNCYSDEDFDENQCRCISRRIGIEFQPRQSSTRSTANSCAGYTCPSRQIVVPYGNRCECRLPSSSSVSFVHAGSAHDFGVATDTGSVGESRAAGAGGGLNIANLSPEDATTTTPPPRRRRPNVRGRRPTSVFKSISPDSRRRK